MPYLTKVREFRPSVNKQNKGVMRSMFSGLLPMKHRKTEEILHPNQLNGVERFRVSGSNPVSEISSPCLQHLEKIGLAENGRRFFRVRIVHLRLVRLDCPEPLFVHMGDINCKGGFKLLPLQIIEIMMRSPRLLLPAVEGGLYLPEPGIKPGLPAEMVCLNVIGVPFRKVRDEKDFRPVLPEEPDQLQAVGQARVDSAVRNVRILSCAPEYLRRFPRLSSSDGRCTARAQLSFRQIDDARFVSGFYGGCERASAAQLGIVGVRPDGKKVEFHGGKI